MGEITLSTVELVSGRNELDQLIANFKLQVFDDDGSFLADEDFWGG